jgi:hypothetical protein
MNRMIHFALIATAAASLSTPAAAQTAAPQGWQPSDTGFVSTKTVEAVQAELFAFKKAGVNPWSGTYDPLKYFVSSRTRASVTAEYLASRDDVAAMNAEDSGSGRRVAERAHVSDTLAAR